MGPNHVFHIRELGFASWLRPCCGAESASLAYAIVYVALWGVVLVEMHRHRIFIGICPTEPRRPAQESK